MLKVSDYDYELPNELIAQYPAAKRTQSRMLKVSADGELKDANILDILDEVSAGDILVVNDTKVIPARILGKKETGGSIELVLERIISDNSVLAQIKASRAPKAGQSLVFECDPTARIKVVGRQNSFFEVEFDVPGSIVEWFEKHGSMPLPPYIERKDQKEDKERYQTVYAVNTGAVAAPTAGLHFNETLLNQFKEKGVDLLKVTLHVGAGTYQPVRVDDIKDHQMHSEWIEINELVCKKIVEAKKRGNKVVAVGTTVVRALESAAQNATSTLIDEYRGETDIFIYPGFEFKVVDKLLTNFHLPQSTLLMLVSAFSGRENMMSAYHHAIEKKYRFFSYGDAMLLTKA